MWIFFCLIYDSSSSSQMRLIPQQYMLGEKEKMKVMQSMENKLMKAIKEVNESEQQHSIKESSPVIAPESSVSATSKLSGDTNSVPR